MVPDTTNTVEQLLPERHPEHDLFICDVSDAVLKDLMAQMEHPFYSLSKKPEMTVRRYEDGRGNWIEVTPSFKGLATIYDKDILIYCISQIMHKIKRGEEVGRRVRINTYDLLVFTNRGTSGRDYLAFQEALERIRGTTIKTNIRTGTEEQMDMFGLIEAASVRRKHGLDGRLLWCEIELSEWVFNAIKAQEVLTLHRDYFRLRKPMERRVYEIARKHCGRQSQWKIGLALLLKKSGSQSPEKKFRLMIRNLAKFDHLPDYHVNFDEEADMVIFTNRGTMDSSSRDAVVIWEGRLDPDVYHDARMAAPGWDVYVLEQEWRQWLGDQEIEPKHPARHFVKFCKSWYERRGAP
jgi:plasmid replication initiation protein